MPNAEATPRIEKLLALMSLEEKLGQLTMLSSDLAVTGPGRLPALRAAVRAGHVGSILNLWGSERTEAAQRVAVEETRLGIPLFFGLDVVHGDRTIFPVPLAEAAAFDPGLWEKTARAAAEEASADGLHLTFAPMLDVARDPRWGRMVEGPGEDPWLAARFGAAKVRGFQSTNIGHVGSIAATAKHFAGYGAVAAGREYASADMSERTLHEVHLPPFRDAIEAGVAAIMPAFTDLAGVPCTSNVALLRGLLRTKWNFDGVIISDYNAIAELVAHGVAADIADAAALALRAGVDIDMTANAYFNGLPKALERGTVTVAEIDACVRRVLRLKAQLGLFDDPYRQGRANSAQGWLTRHRGLAREAACRSIVLLKNHNDILPLDQSMGSIAVIGPFIDAREHMMGSWSAAGEMDTVVGLQEALSHALSVGKLDFACGVSIDDDDGNGIPQAVEIALQADVVILFLGEARTMSGEAASRARPQLPGRQEDLARQVLDIDKPVILLLASGRPLILPAWLVARAHAILATWFLGSEAGNAIADVLFGVRSPTGRLPISWPVDVGQIPIFYASRPTGRPADPANHFSSKYIDVPVEPLFPFGHGLSYTKFNYSQLSVDRRKLRQGERVTVKVTISNVGLKAGEENVLLFVHDPVATVSRPMLELRGMARIALEPGERGIVQFEICTDDLVFLGLDLVPRLESGAIDLCVGPSAAWDVLLKTGIEVLAP